MGSPLTKSCKECKNIFVKKINISLKTWDKTKYCSQNCKSKSQIGKSSGNKGKKCPNAYLNLGKFSKKGSIAPMKGRKRPDITGKKHRYWKGDNVGYYALHRWVERNLGKPDICEHCGESGLSGKQIHWANKSHKYKRDLNDWIRLCVKCHGIYDGTTFKKGDPRLIGSKYSFKKGYIPWNKGLKKVI